MALYEYDCMRCAKRYTKDRSIKEDDPGYECETCNSSLVRVYRGVICGSGGGSGGWDEFPI